MMCVILGSITKTYCDKIEKEKYSFIFKQTITYRHTLIKSRVKGVLLMTSVILAISLRRHTVITSREKG